MCPYKQNIFYIIEIIITAIPIITLYIAKTLKLPFFKYSSKNFITTNPTIKLANIPIQKAISVNTK